MPSSTESIIPEPSPTELELEAFDQLPDTNGRPNSQFSLAPADSGRDAWLFLTTCFFVEAFVWGFPFSFGIFQEYYANHEPFKSKPSGIAIIGSSAMGIMYLGCPFIQMALQRWPNLHRTSCVIGVILIGVSLFASSFSQSVLHLILSQGVLYAIGGSLVYNPVLLLLDEWFVRRKGIAFGIMWAGTGASGATIPFFMAWGLARFEFRTILRIWGVCVCIFLGPMLLFIKPRLPVTLSTESRRRRFDYRFVLSPSFITLQAGNIFQSLGFFIPGIYLPSYARSLGMSGTTTTATLALLNTTGVLGCICVGLMVDRWHVTTVLLLATLGSAFSVFVLWGLSSSVPLLLLFSAVYGFFAGSFTTTYAGVVMEVRRSVPDAAPGLILGLLSAGRGIGSVTSGPLSEALLQDKPRDGKLALGYDSGYQSLIVFTGITIVLGGVGVGAKRGGWIQHRNPHV